MIDWTISSLVIATRRTSNYCFDLQIKIPIYFPSRAFIYRISPQKPQVLIYWLHLNKAESFKLPAWQRRLNWLSSAAWPAARAWAVAEEELFSPSQPFPLSQPFSYFSIRAAGPMEEIHFPSPNFCARLLLDLLMFFDKDRVPSVAL